MRSKLMMFMLVCLSFTGCVRPYDVPEYVEFKPNEIAFVLPMEETEEGQVSTDVYKRNLKQGRVQIPHRWVSKGYIPGTGEYIDTHRVIIADTTPVTRRWEPGTSQNKTGIWAESKDSVGFSTGFEVTAYIASVDDAIIFLQHYPPQRSSDDGGSYDRAVSSLSQAIDGEVKSRIQRVYSRQSAEQTMDLLREEKNEISNEIEKDIIPFFKERGITISTISQFGGFTYENPKIQEAIDNVFAAQQDEEVAKAEFAAAEQRKAALKSEGEGEAAKILEAKKGEAEATLALATAEAEAQLKRAQARQQEVQMFGQDVESYIKLKQLEIDLERVQKWTGVYPQTMLSNDVPILMEMK